MRAAAALVAVLAAAVLVTGCASSGAPPTTTTRTGVSRASPRAQDIELARASNRLFSIFPAGPGQKKCEIPAGGVHWKPLAGTCATSVHPGLTHEPSLIVTFTERWGPPPCPPGAKCPVAIGQRHTWQVIEGEPIVTTTSKWRVLATRESGVTAPQFYK